MGIQMTAFGFNDDGTHRRLELKPVTKTDILPVSIVAANTLPFTLLFNEFRRI